MPRRLLPQYWAAKMSAATVGWLIVILIVALFVLAFVGLRRTAAVQHEIIRETQGQAVADAVWADGYKVLRKIKVEQDAKEQQAVEEYPDWSNDPVPEPIADLLRDPDSKAKR